MRRAVLAILVALGASGAAFAKDLKLPEAKPVILVTLPDQWSPKEVGNGYEATSEDGSTFVAFEAGDPKDLKDLVAKAIRSLAAKGVDLDTASEKKHEGDINGMKAFNVDFTGKFKGGETKVSLTILVPNEEKAVLVTYWGNAEGEKKNGAALGEILKSLKPAG